MDGLERKWVLPAGAVGLRARFGSMLGASVQGYLTQKEPRPPLGPPLGCRWPTVGYEGGGLRVSEVSRGNPVNESVQQDAGRELAVQKADVGGGLIWTRLDGEFTMERFTTFLLTLHILNILATHPPTFRSSFRPVQRL